MYTSTTMDKYHVNEMKIDWDRLTKVRDEARRQRLCAPTEGVPLKTPAVRYLKKWGLEKYRRPRPEKRLRNKLKSIVLDESDGPRVAKYRPISEHMSKAPLLESLEVKAYKRKLEDDEQLNAKTLKRKRITDALAKQGVRAKYKKGFGQQQSEQHCISTTHKLLKGGCKRKMSN